MGKLIERAILTLLRDVAHDVYMDTDDSGVEQTANAFKRVIDRRIAQLDEDVRS